MWKCRSVEVWKCGSVEVRKSGNMQMSLYLTHITHKFCLDLVMWKCGSVEVWKCGSVEVWRCGSVEVRKSANIQMSLYLTYFVLTWKCRSKESLDFPSHYSQLSLAVCSPSLLCMVCRHVS